jgi:hypothetical protein
MARSAIGNTMNRARELEALILPLSEDERNYLLDLLLPETETKPKVKRKRRAAVTTSTRRRGLSEQVKGTASGLCAGVIKFDGGNKSCDALVADPIHDKNGGYAGYHPFQSSATPAGSRLRRRSVPESSVSSETVRDDAEDAAHAASGGD